MARPNASELRQLSDADINDQIAGLRRELFDLRFQQATRQLANTCLLYTSPSPRDS